MHIYSDKLGLLANVLWQMFANYHKNLVIFYNGKKMSPQSIRANTAISRTQFHNNKIDSLDSLKTETDNIIHNYGNNDSIKILFLLCLIKFKTADMQSAVNFGDEPKLTHKLLEDTETWLVGQHPVYQSEIAQVYQQITYDEELLSQLQEMESPLRKICGQYDRQYGKIRDFFGEGYTRTSEEFVAYLETEKTDKSTAIIQKIDKLEKQNRYYKIKNEILFYDSNDRGRNLNGSVWIILIKK